MSTSFEFQEVDRLTTGTVGEPGQRVFYLQIQVGTQVVSLRLEKTQVAALITYLGVLLADLPSPTELPTDLELTEPVVAEWVVGSLGVSYDEDRDRILIVADEMVPNDDPDDPDLTDDDGATARLLVTREQVSALSIRGAEVVSAGRPPCALCGQPLNPDGHLCIRLNGHRRNRR